MSDVKKIRDFQRASQVEIHDNYMVSLRVDNLKWVWHGFQVDDAIAYKRTPHSEGVRAQVKDMSYRLMHHIMDDFPHLFHHKDHGRDKFYRLWRCSIGFLEFQMLEKEDKAKYAFNSAQQTIDFIPMFEKHTKDDDRYHRMYDYGSASWYWYGFELGEEEVGGETFPFVDLRVYTSSVNPELTGDPEEFLVDYGLMNTYVQKHKDDDSPHRITGLQENQMRLVMDGGEIDINLEDLHEYIRV